MFKVIIRSRIVKHDFMSGLSFKEAEELCEEYDWVWVDENGFAWDMEIDDDYGFVC